MGSLRCPAVPTRSHDAGRVVRAICAAALLAASLLAFLGAAPAHAAKPPNMVVFTTDDQTLQEMNDQVLPYTNRWFASEGTTFQNAITISPSCCPSRAAYLTGEYPHNNGVYSDNEGFPSLKRRRDILPAWLQNAGYRTGHFGKFLNHFQQIYRHGDTPAGWDRWYTLENVRYYDYRMASNGQVKHYGSRARDYVTRRITNAATRWIGRYGDRRKPLYLQIDEFAPHSEQGATPGRCPEAAQPDPLDQTLFTDEPLPQAGLDPAERSFNELDVSDKSPAIARRHSLSDHVIENIQRRYRCQLASLAGVDRSFEEVVNALHDAQLAAAHGDLLHVRQRLLLR